MEMRKREFHRDTEHYKPGARAERLGYREIGVAEPPKIREGQRFW
jgi:hypothetical protein